MTPKNQPHAWLRVVITGAILFLAPWLSADEAKRASLTGSVSNVVSGTTLPGALVEIPALHRSTFVNSDGDYILDDIPAGIHTVVVRYTGLDELRQSVEIPSAGGTVGRDFQLNSKIYELPAFEVVGEPEGNAASITRQRNAANVTNVVAIDAFGNLPNMSVGELAMRIPGIAGTTDDNGEITGLIVRGTPNSQNRYTIDGLPMVGNAGLTREFLPNTLNVAMFDEMEVIKGHRPDQSADSLGGTINLKTRSPLSLKGRRQFTYNIGARWAPPFFDHISVRREHPIHPLLNFTYQEVFDAFGGKRNLGISASAFYSQNMVVYDSTQMSYQNTTDSTAYLYSFTSRQALTNRIQTAGNVRMDYRWSPKTKFSFNFVTNDAANPSNKHFVVTATAPQTVATIGSNGQPTGNGAILPGYTELVTQVRNVSGANVVLTSTKQRWTDYRRGYDIGGESDFGALKLDYKAAYTRTRTVRGAHNASTLAITAPTVGWIIDRTLSDYHPVFTQTAGPDLSNIANYNIGQLQTGDVANRFAEVTTLRGNASYDLTMADRFPLRLKAGGEWKRHDIDAVFYNKRWSFIGDKAAVASPVDPGYPLSDTTTAGRNLVYFDAATQLRDDNTADPAVWREDIYFTESEYRRRANVMGETVTAGYVQFQGKISQLGYLGGVRVERTELEAQGITRARVLSTSAQRAADPIGAARLDYPDENLRIIKGDYVDAFPSMHLGYDITRSLKARASWAASIGRPNFANLRPVETPNDDAERLTINNPGLKPQYARNTDLSLEYYFEPAGMFSVGWFKKDIRDYIVSNIDGGTVGAGPDNGYGGQYEGYQIRTSGNAGGAVIQGWEFAYQQQFTFLPGPLKGLSAMLNYTELTTKGDYGGTSIVGTNEVPRFIPRTVNASLSYRYRKFNTRILYSYRSSYLNSISTSSPALNEYYFPRDTVNLSLGYQIRREVQLFCDVTNVFNEPVRRYRYTPSRPSLTSLPGTTISFGVNGRF